MKDLKRKKLEVELAKVDAARMEMELRILEKEEEIQRVKKSIQIQKDRIQEIKLELNEGVDNG